MAHISRSSIQGSCQQPKVSSSRHRDVTDFRKRTRARTQNRSTEFEASSDPESRSQDVEPTISRPPRIKRSQSVADKHPCHRERIMISRTPAETNPRKVSVRKGRPASGIPREHLRVEEKGRVDPQWVSSASSKEVRNTSRESFRPVVGVATAPSTINARKAAASRKAKRQQVGFFSIFKVSPDRHPEKKITCITCLAEDVLISKSAKLACSHRMCHSCLKRIFTLSIKDPQHMPPRCCTSDHIPLRHADKLFDDKFKAKWNRKYQEYTTKNRVYCPAKGCGEWIKPSQIFLDTSGGANGGRKFGKCSRCKTKVCCTCNGKWHSKKECPKDEDAHRFVEMAKDAGWQRCYNCSAMIELKEGCNHMTCRCTAEFCMLCGSKWKSCDCPWFNYNNTGEGDRLNHMNIPHPLPLPVSEGRPLRSPVRYQEELDRRREQERQDEVLARRLQLLDIHNTGDINAGHPPGVGNAMAHFLTFRQLLELANTNGTPAGLHSYAVNVAGEDMLPPNGYSGQRNERTDGGTRYRQANTYLESMNHPQPEMQIHGDSLVDLPGRRQTLRTNRIQRWREHVHP